MCGIVFLYCWVPLLDIFYKGFGLDTVVSDNLRIFLYMCVSELCRFFFIKVEFVKDRFLWTTVSVPMTVPVGRALLA